MRLPLIVASLIVFLSVNQSSAAGLQDGFRGIKWGTPFSDIKDRAFEATDGIGFLHHADEYTVKKDNLSIGNIPLDYISYFFDKDTHKFVGISMRYDNKHDKAMKSAVLQAFGGEKGFESCKDHFKPLHIYLGTCIIVYKLPEEPKKLSQPSASGGTF